MASNLAKWTATTLAAHLRGVVAQDSGAPGGTVPDRMLQVVIASGVELWNIHDWMFRLKQGTLTVIEDSATAYLPEDFAEIYHRYLANYDEGVRLRLYDDPAEFQEIANAYDSSDSDDAAPMHGLIIQEAAISSAGLGVLGGEAIAQYEFVYVSDWDTSSPTVKKADATTIATCRTIYWASAAFAFDAAGTVYTYGTFTSTINNTGAADATAYLSAVTPGLSAIAAPTTPGSKTVELGTFTATGASAPVTLDLTDWRLSWSWRVQFADTSDDDYTFDFWYMTADPWASGEITDDATAPQWPNTFHEGWRLLARYKLLDDYSKDDDTINRARRTWETWLERQRAENDETISVQNVRIQDGYQDFGRRTLCRREIRDTA